MAEPRTPDFIPCTIMHKIFTEKSSLFPCEQLWMSPLWEVTFTLGLLFIWLRTLSDCCFDSVKLFLLPAIQGCFFHVSVSFWGLGQGALSDHTEMELLFWAFVHWSLFICCFLGFLFFLHLTGKSGFDDLETWWENYSNLGRVTPNLIPTGPSG